MKKYTDAQTRAYKDLTENRIKCKCSHTVLFSKKTKYTICTYCGNMIFRTKKDEFDYRIRQSMIKMKKEKIY